MFIRFYIRINMSITKNYKVCPPPGKLGFDSVEGVCGTTTPEKPRARKLPTSRQSGRDDK